MSLSQNVRAVLALNFDSASLKAASYSFLTRTEAERPAVRETGLISVETMHDTSATPEEDEEEEMVDAIAMQAFHRRLRAGVRGGGTGIYQILASSRNRGECPVPLSQGDFYAGHDGHFTGVS